MGVSHSAQTPENIARPRHTTHPDTNWYHERTHMPSEEVAEAYRRAEGKELPEAWRGRKLDAANVGDMIQGYATDAAAPPEIDYNGDKTLVSPVKDEHTPYHFTSSSLDKNKLYNKNKTLAADRPMPSDADEEKAVQSKKKEPGIGHFNVFHRINAQGKTAPTDPAAPIQKQQQESTQVQSLRQQWFYSRTPEERKAQPFTPSPFNNRMAFQQEKDETQPWQAVGELQKQPGQHMKQAEKAQEFRYS